MPRRAKILLIDDDDDIRASTRALLEGEGYDVIEASGGQAGLSVAAEQHPDLIVLDVMMESLSEGYSVNQAIKFAPQYQEIAGTSILMVSSTGMDPANLYGWIGDTACITPDAFMSKPIDVSVFLARVRELLHRPTKSGVDNG